MLGAAGAAHLRPNPPPAAAAAAGGGGVVPLVPLLYSDHLHPRMLWRRMDVKAAREEHDLPQFVSPSKYPGHGNYQLDRIKLN